METRSSILEIAAPPVFVEPPRLLIEWPSRRKVFFNNLFDLLLRRQLPQIAVTSKPAPFWADVFVASGVRWSRFFEAVTLHVLAIAILVSLFGLVRGVQRQQNPELELHDKVAYYHVSEYLPPIDTGSQPVKTEEQRPPRKADPLPAKQKIISLPPNHDNSEQTIIAAPDIKLKQHVNLPNIVAVNQAPLPVPTAAATREISQLQIPISPNSIVAPPPDPAQGDLSRANLSNFQAQIVAPQPAIDPSKLSERRIPLGNPAVVPPPPTIDQAKLNNRQLAIPVAGDVQPPPPPPATRRPSSAAEARQLAAQFGRSAPAAPAPAIRPDDSNKTANQLIALSVNPDANAPVLVPNGSRSGEFAVGPEGKPNATGVPEIKSTGPGTTSPSSSNPSHMANVPPGIVVAPPPNAPEATTAGTPGKTSAQPSLLAMARLPPISTIPHNSPSTTNESNKIEDKVFNGKKSYSMTLNMPNLSSAGGSWVVHFAQLDDDKTTGDLSAPIATVKVDPAYPPDLRRELVEGTVVLYAVIRKDGTVSDVRVLHGIQSQLDENACAALMHWHFTPGTKNGSPVDLEAVVRVPYKAHALPF